MSESNQPARAVFTAIRNVMSDMAKEGVGKNQTNQQQNFRYRGVDDVMDALAPSLSKHGLIIIPHVVSREVVERESRQGSKLFHTLLQLEYDFVCADDGSQVSVGPVFGEAMDSGDKATNKAMATAYKYACIQTFCIPITGDDPDAQSHELATKDDAPAPMRRTRSEEPKQPSRAVQATSTAPERQPAPPRQATPGGAKPPDAWRPSGNFAYGKKFYDTPWSVMQTHDLEWFLNAERTPQATREKIVAELAWRDHETSTLEAAEAAHRAELDKPFDDQIP